MRVLTILAAAGLALLLLACAAQAPTPPMPPAPIAQAPQPPLVVTNNATQAAVPYDLASADDTFRALDDAAAALG